MLTQLINNSGISICMVGTPEASPFFENVDYLSRRALGLRYGNCEYNAYFREFCSLLFSYQYVENKSVISESITQWIYEHSAGVSATVVSLIHDAQEISILNGREVLDMTALNEAYEQRMGMMHSHIKPAVIKKTAIEKKKRDNASDMIGRSQQKEKEQTSSYETVYDTVQNDNNDCVMHSADKGDVPDWTFLELAEYAKRNQCDVLSLLKGKISITEIAV